MVLIMVVVGVEDIMVVVVVVLEDMMTGV